MYFSPKRGFCWFDTKQASCFGFANFTSNLLSFFLPSFNLSPSLPYLRNKFRISLSLSLFYFITLAFLLSVCVCFVLLASFWLMFCWQFSNFLPSAVLLIVPP
uniref:(northern house mosquito) hypothetical protein n=1 Tax=Culex pipiens TaxID=7175 RepID=A0A8D8ADS2_CULPI